MDLQGQERLLWHGRLRTSVVMVTEKYRFSWEKEQTASASGLENLNGSYVYSLTRWGTDLTVERGCRQILDIASKLLLLSLDPLYLHLRPRLTVFPSLTIIFTSVFLFIRLTWWGHLLFSLMKLMDWLLFAQVDRTRFTGKDLFLVNMN